MDKDRYESKPRPCLITALMGKECVICFENFVFCKILPWSESKDLL